MQQAAGKKIAKIFWAPLGRLVNNYENFIGLTEVRLAQRKVLEAEETFTLRQKLRRHNQKQLQALQSRYKDLQSELERTSRADDRYLLLLTEEHKLIKEERQVVVKLEELETDERDAFNTLSACVRESHERERERVERTKYWSIIGSGIGAALGVVGTLVSGERRMRELRKIVRMSSDKLDGAGLLQQDLLRNVKDQNGKLLQELKDFFEKHDLTTNSVSNKYVAFKFFKKIEAQQAEQVKCIKQFSDEMVDVKRLISFYLTGQEAANARAEPIVYVGSEMQSMLSSLKINLERRIDIATVCGVAVIVAFSYFMLKSCFSKY